MTELVSARPGLEPVGESKGKRNWTLRLAGTLLLEVSMLGPAESEGPQTPAPDCVS